MKELRVDKKLRNKIIGTGYKKTVEWTQAKIKRIIFIDIFAATTRSSGIDSTDRCVC